MLVPKLYDKQIETAIEMENLVGNFSGMQDISFVLKDNNKQYNKETFRREIQKKAWDLIFKKMNIEKYLTSNVKNNIYRFIKEHKNIPFTIKNVNKMIDLIVQTYPNQIDKSIEEVFDIITNHFHENRLNLEGWKTNSNYILNQKFILPNIIKLGYDGIYKVNIGHYYVNAINDLIKVLCFLSGEDFNSYIPFYDSITKEHKANKWYNYIFFEIKYFKKGTMHFKFKDLNLLNNFNKNVGRIKGFVLPEKL